MWASEKEIEQAKQYDVLEYLQRADPYELVKSSRDTYHLRSHDSFKISNGMWYWFSRDIGGRSAVDYLIKVKGYQFVDAVREINSVMKGKSPSFFMPEKEKKPFELPEKNGTNDVAIRYLCSRGIDEELVKGLIDKGLIFENKKHHSVVFVGLDENGKPAHASYRATMNGLRGDFTGSDKRYAFRLECPESRVVRIFEGAIDLLSYMTLCRRWGKEYSHESLISTAGASCAACGEGDKTNPAIDSFLKRNPAIETVIIQYDNDAAGRRCAEQIKEVLRDRYRVKIVIPKLGKDYNDYLQITGGGERHGRKNDHRCDHGRAGKTGKKDEPCR